MISQNQVEHLLHKQHVKEAVRLELVEDLMTHIDHAVLVLKDWMMETKWGSHERRKDAIRYHHLEDIAVEIFTTITLHCSKGLPLISVGGMVNLSHDLTKLDNIQLVCDLIALLVPVGLYGLDKSIGGTYIIQSLVKPSDELQRQIYVGCYLPPMVERPQLLTSNSESGYKTINKDTVILGGRDNDHSGNISLDVINTMNANEYVLDTFITDMTKPFNKKEIAVNELARMSHKDRESYHNSMLTYDRYLEQFNHLKNIIKDRTVYLTHKPDKRGRLYAQGYHFNTQGTGYEKASFNLKKKELITGEL